jgi:flavin-dependent dehydrogenase
MLWDVAIIGSGPAGNALAIHCCNAGLRTAIFTCSGTPRETTVPETLPVAARPLLDTLGIPSECGVRPQYAMSSAWGSEFVSTRHSICNPSGPGWIVDRPSFDAAISRRAAEVGAGQFSARLVSAARENGEWLLRFYVPNQSEPVTVRATFVVDATGRASAFARRIGVRRLAYDRLICVTARAIPRGSTAGECLVESAPDGWWFSAPAAHGELSVSWFTDAGLLQLSDRCPASFDIRLRTTIHTAARVDRLLPRKLVFRPARTSHLSVFSGDHWTAVGDAAVACDPLGSQGLLRAFESAAMASDLIVMNRTDYAKNLRSYNEFQIYYLKQFLRDRHHFYSMERRWPDALFWRTRC